MPGYKQRFNTCFFEFCFENSERLYRKLVVFGKGGNKTVTAVGTEPQSVAREKIFVVDKIDDMSPCMTRNEIAMDFYIAYAESFAVFNKSFLLFIVTCGSL